MNKTLKLVIIFTLLVAVALLSYFWATTNTPTPAFEPRRLPFDRIDWDKEWFHRGDIELFYTVKTVLSTINATLLVFLLVTYVDIYKKLKSEFTIGLIILSMILLLHALVSNPLMQSIFGF